MLHPELKSKIDKLWNTFWGNGISDPLTAIEQINYLIFFKRIDDIDAANTIKAKRVSLFEYESIFVGEFESLGKTYNKEILRWSHFMQLPSLEMFEVVRDGVFPFFKSLDNDFKATFKDAIFMIPNAELLTTAVLIIEDLQITKQNYDTTGDIYEYLLNQLSSAGKGGQFRTPRHIIQMIVSIINPTINDKILDPACGTGGFLINAYKHIIEQNTSKNGIIKSGDDITYSGDLLTNNHWDKLKSNTFYGYDFDSKMARIGSMNALLHGLKNPNIKYQDTLGKNFSHSDEYDVILANPPFKGSILKNNIHPDFEVQTTKTELLFLELIYDKLFVGGRAGVIIPDGVLFGASNAHKKIREMIVEKSGLKAVISLPSGVFKPYAGVSTAILIFTKGDITNKVWFYDLETDGYTLDDKRTLIDQNDIPDVISKYKSIVDQRKYDLEPSKSDKWFFVDKSEIVANNYDLSISKYKKIEYIPVEYESSDNLIKQIKEIDIEIDKAMNDLESMI